MTSDEQLRLVERFLRVRRLELEGATEGERAAAVLAFDRIASKHGGDPDQLRTEIDRIAAQLAANPNAKLAAKRPTPRRPVFVVCTGWPSSWGSSMTGATDTSTWTF